MIYELECGELTTVIGGLRTIKWALRAVFQDLDRCAFYSIVGGKRDWIGNGYFAMAYAFKYLRTGYLDNVSVSMVSCPDDETSPEVNRWDIRRVGV